MIGLNVSTNDIAYLCRVIERVAGRAEVHVGGPLHALSALALGGQGFLSAEANIAPRLARAVTDAWDRADLPGAAAAYARLMALYTSRPGFAGGRERALDQGRARVARPAGRRPARAEPAAASGRARARSRGGSNSSASATRV